jgi:2'-5' RNA ligase
MHELQNRHVGVPIDHGIRTQDGGEWAKSMYGEPGKPNNVLPYQEQTYMAGWTLDGKPVLKYHASVRNVSDSKSDGDGITQGIMIALVPPEDLAQRLAVEDGEDPAQIHLTLAYLGQTGEYSAQQLADLKETVAAWAEAHEPLSATVQGSGTFVKAQEDGQHVLWASVDAPGLERLHVSLVDYLLERGYHPSMNHVFVPHMTLAYEKHHVRFLPKVERETWTASEVWVCIAGRWESVALGAEDSAIRV